jgi:hypothetical protein
MQRTALQVCRYLGFILGCLIATSAPACADTAASPEGWNEFRLPTYHCKVMIPFSPSDMQNLGLLGWNTQYQGTYYVIGPMPLAGWDGDQSTIEGIKRAFLKNKDGVSHKEFPWQVTSGPGWKGISWQVPSDKDDPRYGIHAVSDNNDYSYELTVQGKVPEATAQKYLQSLVVTPGQKWTLYNVPNESWSVRIPGSADQVKELPSSKGVHCVEYNGAIYAFGTNNESTAQLTGVPQVLAQWQKNHGTEGLTVHEIIGEGWFGAKWSTASGVTPQRTGIYVVSKLPAYANHIFQLGVEGPAAKEDVDLFLGVSSLTLINK